MLTVTIPETEYYNEENNQFFTIQEKKITLEHSLVSVSKWESKYHKPFLANNNKTTDEVLDYIKMMTITQNVDPIYYTQLSKQNIEDIQKYIDNPMTATWFTEDLLNNTNPQIKKKSKEIVTSEIIYYWMIALQIPFECQKWHLNRLMTLIRVVDSKQQKPKKMSKKELARRNTALNEMRRAKARSKG